MTRKLYRNSNNQTNSNNQSKLRLVPRRRVEEMLREIAFVLKMSRQVREQMEAEQEVAEPTSV